MSELIPGKRMGDPIFVIPNHYPLTDAYHIWHHLLQQKGWNDLPEEVRFGEVVDGWFTNWIDVYFPAIDCTIDCIAIDEVRRIPPPLKRANHQLIDGYWKEIKP